MSIAMTTPSTVQTCSYLGTKGYTIPKSALTPEQLAHLRATLMAKPFNPGAPVMAAPTPFPVYRESAKKIYIPRYVGEAKFGRVPFEIGEGDAICVPFVGELRPYQQHVVDIFARHIQTCGGGLLELYTAWGKTSAALYILSAIVRKKTLVIVHKEFLMNQWIERIGQFLPTARVGKIQASVVDIADKDIVLCMLQSLSMKDYPADTFASFGFTIIDEVHHIASETFSNALFKVVTRHTLGLSATMNRKDGTTPVFKMFIGDVIFKSERAKSDTSVSVHSILYKESASDPDFNEVDLDVNGKPQLSRLISKICANRTRAEFAVRILADLVTDRCADVVASPVEEPPTCAGCGRRDQFPVRLTCCDNTTYCIVCIDRVALNTPLKSQTCMACGKKGKLKYRQHFVPRPNLLPLEQRHIIVLAHNLSLLEYLYKRIVSQNIAPVGYYVGGMKERDLKQSEKQQIILATYQMAAEALDIPSLNTEVLLSPKTDIVQCVGRILRVKHAHPMIIDLYDTHDPLRNQYFKRLTYYKQQGYDIYKTTSALYSAAFWDKKRNGLAEDGADNDLTENEDGNNDEPRFLQRPKRLLKLF